MPRLSGQPVSVIRLHVPKRLPQALRVAGGLVDITDQGAA
jgi:hypothetical protein